MANYYMYDPENPGVAYPMKADKKSGFTLFGEAKSNRCPKCARRMGKRKKVCKCGYERKDMPRQGKYRLFALLFLVLAALAVVYIPYGVLSSMEYNAETALYTIDYQKNNLINMVQFGMPERLFSVVPAFAIGHTGEAGLLYSLSVYVYIVCAAIAALIAVFAVLSREKAAKRVRRALFFLGMGALAYTIGFTGCLHTMMKGDDVQAIAGLLTFGAFSIDLVSAAIAVGCLVLSGLFLARAGKAERLAKKAKKLSVKAEKAKF